MKRRDLRAGLTVVIAALLLAAAATGHVRLMVADSVGSCQSAGARLVLHAGRVEVFRTPLVVMKAHTLSGGPAHYDSVYACWTPTGRRTKLARETPDDYTEVKVVDVAAPSGGGGPYVAVSIAITSQSGSQVAVSSHDVQTGATVHHNGRDVDRFTSAAFNMRISSILVTPTGSLAWIGSGDCSGRTPADALTIFGVFAIGSDGREVAEQCGAPGGPVGAFTALSYAGGTLRWSGHGQAMSAALR